MRVVQRLRELLRDDKMLARALALVACMGLVVGVGAVLMSRRTASTPACVVVHVPSDGIAPALALRTLAGESDSVVLDQALEESKLETALATLYYSTGLDDQQRANYWMELGQKYAEAGQQDRARLAYGQASSILLLSANIADSDKAQAFLALGKNLVAIKEKADAERVFDYAYTTSRYSPYIAEAQRRFVLGALTSEYKALGLDRKSDESTVALASLPPTAAAPVSPAQIDLPAPALGQEVFAATAWRQRAAQGVTNSMGGKNSAGLADALRNLENALRAEDDLRSMALENRLGQSPTPEERASLTNAQAQWQAVRRQVVERGFGLSLMPDWEKGSADISTKLRQSLTSYFLLRKQMAANLSDPIDAAQARVDLVAREMMTARLGLSPDCEENRLVSDLAQATKERIDLREDGLYVSVLSQGGQGLLVITTADLWGRPAAMASAGLGMSFPTLRPPVYSYLTIATPVPSMSPVVRRSPTPDSSGPSSSSGSPVVIVVTATAEATQPAARPTLPVIVVPTVTPHPTQPSSPPPGFYPSSEGTPTSGLALGPSPTPYSFSTPFMGPSPTPIATLAALATATPAYNYQVIYSSGPVLQQSTGNDNFHIVGMVVDPNGILITGIQESVSWCCPAGEAIHPRPTIDVDNGRFDFFVGRGQFTVVVIDGGATTEPIVVNTDQSMSGYVEWQYTIQHTLRGILPWQTRTPTATATPTATGTPPPPSPTPPLPGAVTTQLQLLPGWNFVTLPLSPVYNYTAASLQAEINNQINGQGGGVSTVGYWDGARISEYSGQISLGVGYFLNITGTNRVFYNYTGYPMVAPAPINLSQSQKNSIGVPYMAGGFKSAAQLAADVNAAAGAGTFVRLWRLKDSSGNWEYYDGTPTGIASFTLAPWTGYLLEVTRSFLWQPWLPSTPTPTPTATSTPTETATATPTAFDTYEPNNTFNQAAQMSPDFPVISYISYAGDPDYYKFTTSGPSTLYVSLTNLPDDYDLYLYNAHHDMIGYSANPGLVPEYITNTVTISGTYYVLVQGAGPVYDTVKPYKLLLTTGP